MMPWGAWRVFSSFSLVQDRKTASHAELPQWCSVCAKKKGFVSMSLADVKPGGSAVVTKINAVGALRQRLLDMGVLPETTIDIERVGLGGDPFWVRCQGARLALRRSEANSILVRMPD
jgi:Fe2+ transport system protein FeoA